ncbi:hypothetical protein IFR05_006147 [Cadophora sp. M221]|nr:hypothetical protein IFR05_006147 [Cadophora sp. M221]
MGCIQHFVISFHTIYGKVEDYPTALEQFDTLESLMWFSEDENPFSVFLDLFRPYQPERLRKYPGTMEKFAAVMQELRLKEKYPSSIHKVRIDNIYSGIQAILTWLEETQ